MTKDELIGALGKATGPDRELDKAILLALGYSWRGMAYWFRDDSHAWEGNTHFTASIDAALTLVLERGGPWSAWNWAVRYMADEGATPPLAICIAALKAHAHD